VAAVDARRVIDAAYALLAERDAARDMAWFWEIVDRDGLTDLPSCERTAISMLVGRAARLTDVLAERDAARAHVESERDIVHSLRADVARWRDECERLRLGGCARGQTTTQWCAEAVEMMAQRDHWRAVAADRGQKVAAAFTRGAEAMRERAAKGFDQFAYENGRAECCGNGAPQSSFSAPECCGDPDYWIDAQRGAAAIRALPLPEPEAPHG
jgi:hypothetical protein